MKPHIIILQFFFLLLSVFCYSQGHYIGQNYGGGIIFFIDGSGEHGLIVAPNDQAKDRIWGFVGSSPGYKSVTGATSLDNGSLNTEKIIQTIPLPETSAAFICDTLTLGGFTDWYLPAIRELRQIYDKQDFIKNFSLGDYCSSTENDLNKSWNIHFEPRKTIEFLKAKDSKSFIVRCVRSF